MAAKLDSKRRLLIPTDVAQAAGWTSEDDLDVFWDGNVVVVGTPDQLAASVSADMERMFGDEDPAELILAARRADQRVDDRRVEVA